MAGIDIDQGQCGGGRGSGPQGRHGAGPEGCRHGCTAAAGQGDDRRGGARLEHGRGAGRRRIGRGPQPSRQLVDRPGAQRRNNRGIVDDREERSLRRRRGGRLGDGRDAGRLSPADDDGRVRIDRSIAQGGGEILSARRGHVHDQASGQGAPGARDEAGFGHRDRPLENGDQPQQARLGGEGQPLDQAPSRRQSGRQSRRGKLDIDPVRARQQADPISRGLRQIEDDAGGVGMQPQADLENSLLRPCPAGKQA